MADGGPAHLSIGEVLGLLLEEFPDVTISKIRFLESQGLIEPERTPSGYRKFFDDDVELLRVILREQRENFLPLRVIKDRIDSGELDPTPPQGSGPEEEPTPANIAKHPAASRGSGASPRRAGATAAEQLPARTAAGGAAPQGDARLLPGVLLSRSELCAMAKITEADLAQLEDYGVVAKRGSDLYGEEAVEIASAAGDFLRAGVDARHLRAWRHSVDREAGLFEQLVLPVLRHRNPEARGQAVAQLEQLAAVGARLRAAMMRAALRRYFQS